MNNVIEDKNKVCGVVDILAKLLSDRVRIFSKLNNIPMELIEKIMDITMNSSDMEIYCALKTLRSSIIKSSRQNKIELRELGIWFARDENHSTGIPMILWRMILEEEAIHRDLLIDKINIMKTFRLAEKDIRKMSGNEVDQSKKHENNNVNVFNKDDIKVIKTEYSCPEMAEDNISLAENTKIQKQEITVNKDINKKERTSSQVKDEEEMKAIYYAYKGNGGKFSYSSLEKEFNLRDNNGMNAYRIVKLYEKILKVN